MNAERSSDNESSSAALVSQEGCVPSPVSTSNPPRLAYGIAETALMLGVCQKTVRRLICRGLLRPSRALRHLLISKKEIDRFLEETTTR